LLEILPEVCIARTSWLFGHAGKCFPATILKLASTRPEISVANDQRGSPTLTRDLASALVQLCHASARGIVHVTNSGNCTWYEFATEIVRASGMPTAVKPVPTAEFPRPARRPAYSVLSPASLHAYNIHMPEWQDALRRYLGRAPPVLPQRTQRNTKDKLKDLHLRVTSCPWWLMNLAHYLDSPARCPSAAAVVYPYFSSRNNREQAFLVGSARRALHFAYSLRAFRPAVSPGHVPGTSLAHDRTVSWRSHCGDFRRSGPTECLLHGPEQRRSLENNGL